MDQKVCLNLVKLDQLCAIALMKREEILRVLLKMVPMATSQPLEVLFDSTNANNPCLLTKQDLIFKQAYHVGFCFVLFNKLKF